MLQAAIDRSQARRLRAESRECTHARRMAKRSPALTTRQRRPYAAPTSPLSFPSQAFVNGTVRIKLYKGSATVDGRKSNFSLYNQARAGPPRPARAALQRRAARARRALLSHTFSDCASSEPAAWSSSPVSSLSPEPLLVRGRRRGVQPEGRGGCAAAARSRPPAAPMRRFLPRCASSVMLLADGGCPCCVWFRSSRSQASSSSTRSDSGRSPRATARRGRSEGGRSANKSVIQQGTGVILRLVCCVAPAAALLRRQAGRAAAC